MSNRYLEETVAETARQRDHWQKEFENMSIQYSHMAHKFETAAAERDMFAAKFADLTLLHERTKADMENQIRDLHARHEEHVHIHKSEILNYQTLLREETERCNHAMEQSKADLKRHEARVREMSKQHQDTLAQCTNEKDQLQSKLEKEVATLRADLKNQATQFEDEKETLLDRARETGREIERQQRKLAEQKTGKSHKKEGDLINALAAAAKDCEIVEERIRSHKAVIKSEELEAARSTGKKQEVEDVLKDQVAKLTHELEEAKERHKVEIKYANQKIEKLVADEDQAAHGKFEAAAQASYN